MVLTFYLTLLGSRWRRTSVQNIYRSKIVSFKGYCSLAHLQPFRSYPWQVNQLYVRLFICSPSSYRNWYRPRADWRWRSEDGKVTAGLAESNGTYSVVFMTNVIFKSWRTMAGTTGLLLAHLHSVGASIVLLSGVCRRLSLWHRRICNVTHQGQHATAGQ